MDSSKGLICYKGFRLVDGVPLCDRFGRDTEYPFGEYVEVEGPLKLCENGIHFCTDPMDCLRFYTPNQSDNVIGVAEAFGVSDEEEQWTTKRVARAIRVDAKVGDMWDYQSLTGVVKRRTVGTRTMSHVTECLARPHADILTYDDRVWLYGIGWTIGDTDDILLSAGRSCLVAGDDICLSVAVAFGKNSVCVGDVAIAMASCCLARTTRSGGMALTVKDMSIAVAEESKSIAVAKSSYSRAVANETFSTAVAVRSDSLVILNHPGCVGVSYGSARVNAHGCTIILMPGVSHSFGRLEDSYYSSVATLQGVDGTLVLVFDPQYLRWLSVRLQKDHKTYPSDRLLDVQWLVETIRSRAHENNPG